MPLMEIVGWSGAALVLIAYALLSMGKLSGSSPRYQIMNILGSLLLVFYLLWKDAVPSAILNVIWCAIGIYALYGIQRARKQG